MNMVITKRGVFFRRLPDQERFRQQVIATWRESGGEPDAAPGVAKTSQPERICYWFAPPNPLVFCIRPADYMWQWPATFIEVYLPRLQQMGRIDEKFANDLLAQLKTAGADTNALMVTPLVLEIIAEKR